MTDSTTLYVRGMPVPVVREAKSAAALRGITLAALISEALGAYLSDTESALTDTLKADQEWYNAHKTELLKLYGGQHLAIVDGHVIDHDPDWNVLAKRLEGRYQHSIFMPFCHSEERRPARIRSPRRARA